MTNMSHFPTDDERAFSDQPARLCAQTLAPQSAETDGTLRFAHAQLAALAELGVLGANLPEPHGPGIPANALLLTVAQVAGACASTASALTAHSLAADCPHLGGDAALQARCLPAAAPGRALGAFALTEPNAGSDRAEMATKATCQGDHYHLKGAKCFISNGGVADIVVVYTVTDPTAGSRGISAFVVDKATPGCTPGWARSRTIGGVPLANRQGIPWQLADMATSLAAAQFLAHEAARQRQLGLRFPQAAAKAKLYAGEMAHRVTDAALKLYGGYGFTRDFPLERLARAARILRIFEGRTEIQRTIIADQLLANRGTP